MSTVVPIGQTGPSLNEVFPGYRLAQDTLIGRGGCSDGVSKYVLVTIDADVGRDERAWQYAEFCRFQVALPS